MLQHGIDLHKRTVVIATVDSDGVLLRRSKLPARRPDLIRYFDSLDGPHRAVVEATGSWYWVADVLKARGVELKLAHARQLKAVAAAKVKTDAVDALTLAQLLRVNLIPEAHMVSPELRGYRDVLRTRLRLVQKRTSAKNSISRTLEKYNAQNPGELPPFAYLQFSVYDEQIQLLARQIKELEQLLQEHLIPDDEIQRLLWIPGIGKLGAFTILLETDGMERFPSARHFFSYCRLVPGAANSGGKTKHRASKEGNRYLKATFGHAALRAIQYYPEIRAFYQKKARRKNRWVARSIVAKEIARIAYYVLHDQVDFNGTFKGVPLTHLKQPLWPRRASPGV
jgi:transposase